MGVEAVLYVMRPSLLPGDDVWEWGAERALKKNVFVILTALLEFIHRREIAVNFQCLDEQTGCCERSAERAGTSALVVFYLAYHKDICPEIIQTTGEANSLVGIH